MALVLAGGLAGAAVNQELRKPASERKWAGEPGGIVSYDPRPPTRQQVVAEFWPPRIPGS